MKSRKQPNPPTVDYPHRKAVLVTLLWFTAVGGAVFALFNSQLGNYRLAVAEAGMMLFAATLMFVVPRTSHLQRWIMIFLLPFFVVMMYALTTPLAKVTVFAWVVLIPILSHLLLGRWLGMSVGAFFLTAAGVIFVWKYGVQTSLDNAAAIANIALSAISVFWLSHVYEVSRERADRRLRELALTDPLTGLANRTRFHNVFEREHNRYRRTRTPLSILELDLDHFKLVNDRYGHEAGDAVLRFIAHLIEQRLRSTDLACRLGGEEFGVILADTDARQALNLAEGLRKSAETWHCSYQGKPIPVTMSIGIAEFGADGENLDGLLAAADRRLYQAKAEGRNRVVWQDEPAADRTLDAVDAGHATNPG